jgi:hypothetical protein
VHGSSPGRARDQISDLVTRLGDIITVLHQADPAEVYRQLGLRLTYHPAQQKVRVHLDASEQRGHELAPKGCRRHEGPLSLAGWRPGSG